MSIQDFPGSVVTLTNCCDWDSMTHNGWPGLSSMLCTAADGHWLLRQQTCCHDRDVPDVLVTSIGRQTTCSRLHNTSSPTTVSTRLNNAIVDIRLRPQSSAAPWWVSLSGCYMLTHTEPLWVYTSLHHPFLAIMCEFDVIQKNGSKTYRNAARLGPSHIHR